MKRDLASGLEWAKQLPRGARIHWAELEAHVLREHRSVLSLLGQEAADVRMQGRAFSIAAGVIIVLACIVGLAVVWAPIWGLATLAGDAFGERDVDGAMAIPVAGAAMIVSCIVHVGLLIRRALTHGVGGVDDRSIGGGTVVLGVLTLVGILMVGARQQPEGWGAWTVPTILGIVLGFVNFFLGRHSRESAGPFAKRRPNTEVPDITRRERIRSAVAALAGDERERLLADRQRAIEWLRMQGTIKPDEARRAGRAELGLLKDSV